MIAVRRVPIEASPRVPTGTTNAYVVGHDDGVLIDPADRTATLDEVVEKREPSRLLVTHTHPDHIGGVAEYAAEYDLTVLARAGYEARFERVTGIRPDRTIRDGAHVEAGSTDSA